MTSAEALVLVSAALLVLAVSVEAGSGALPPRTGGVLLALAMLAVCVALLHMGAK
jgi:hypothetical protein